MLPKVETASSIVIDADETFETELNGELSETAIEGALYGMGKSLNPSPQLLTPMEFLSTKDRN